ncbi:hypothetical protein DC31_01955 [Microbacterium sp. CH12i]|uniref:hypothetical protein n=1 Tax=Microbacterium sp. CH12i TaxID=1479651 RepID=UPI000461ED97|nr:hypothetical protein [Microbacterium sp. CH12i]KDA04886.1 hypothetical protein DC31_01955 [Microbacterium sp. CH12i]
MTLADLLRALLRRWPVVLVGLAITAGVTVIGTSASPVYHSRTEVVFLAPVSARYPNELVTQTESLIVTAGAVARRINGAESPVMYGSSLANPVGAPGNGEKTWISLISIGTQWVPVFDDQVLLIDAIGDTPEKVTDRIQTADEEIRGALLDLQMEQGVNPVAHITTRMSPAEPVVAEIKGSRVRAMGMTAVIGGLLTIAAVVVLEVRSRSPRDQRTSLMENVTAPVTR